MFPGGWLPEWDKPKVTGVMKAPKGRKHDNTQHKRCVGLGLLCVVRSHADVCCRMSCCVCLSGLLLVVLDSIAKIQAGLAAQEQKIADYNKVRSHVLCARDERETHVTCLSRHPQSLGDRRKQKGVLAFLRGKPAWQR